MQPRKWHDEDALIHVFFIRVEEAVKQPEENTPGSIPVKAKAFLRLKVMNVPDLRRIIEEVSFPTPGIEDIILKPVNAFDFGLESSHMLFLLFQHVDLHKKIEEKTFILWLYSPPILMNVLV